MLMAAQVMSSRRWLACVLVAIAVVSLPSVEGVSSPQELAPAGGAHRALIVAGFTQVPYLKSHTYPSGDHPSFLEVGEAAPAEAVAKSRIADALDPTKQNTLKVIEKLMEAPIIDPRQEKAYKTAAVTVDKVKNHIKSDLMKVVQMEILSQRVNELDAKKAMGLSGDVEHWLKQGATAMDTAIKSGAGALPPPLRQNIKHCGASASRTPCDDSVAHFLISAGCEDSHPGLCAGVQVQGA